MPISKESREVLQKEITEVEKNFEPIDARIKELQDKLKYSNDRSDALTSQIAELQNKRSKIKDKADKMKGDINAA